MKNSKSKIHVRLRQTTKSLAGGQNSKIIVMMSGGVDSSVAAALSKQAGFEVKGVFMKLVDLPGFKQAEKRARRVAEILKIPFLVLDLRKEFKRKVIDYFIGEYKAGRTPNPCVVCNKEIKFGALFKELKRRKIEFDFVATGHYARLRREIPNPLDAKRTPRRVAPQIPRFKLLRAKDRQKDQSYFLWTLEQKQLKKILFPLGDYTKKEVIGLARKFSLPIYKRIESQEICFIQKKIDDFLKNKIKQKPGSIVDTKGKIIGKHQGLAFYTIGQRKGIKLGGGPYYVSGKDTKRNLLFVTKNKKDLYKKELIAKNINWISGKAPKLPLKVKARIRYRHKAASATITKIKKAKTYKLKFDRPQRAITPGQSVVFYLPASLCEALQAGLPASLCEALQAGLPASLCEALQAGQGDELLGGGVIM